MLKQLKVKLNRFAQKKMRQKLLASADHVDNIEALNSLINKEKTVGGYIPISANQTELIIYNFFGFNYGFRSDAKVLIALTDEKFIPINTRILNLKFRQIIWDKIDTSSINELVVFCVVILFHGQTRKNHGLNGGHLRFWGGWNNFSAFVHSMPIPSTNLQILRDFYASNNAKKADRRFYPGGAQKVTHCAPIDGFIEIGNRGDLSGIVDLEYGYTLLSSSTGEITSCFHNSPFTRDQILSSSLSKDHIIALPPIPNVDGLMYFGECCTSGSIFTASLWSESGMIVEKKITVNVAEPIRILELFPHIGLIGDIPLWIRFTPLSGHHREYFVSVIYLNKINGNMYDCTHSHNFSLRKIPNTRALKFAPFKIKNEFSDPIIKKSKKYCSILAVWGVQNLEVVQYRVRIFSASDINFEAVRIFKVKPQTLNFTDLGEILSFSEMDGENFIVQLESEEHNLDANLYCYSMWENNVLSVSVDHLTGG